MTFYY